MGDTSDGMNDGRGSTTLRVVSAMVRFVGDHGTSTKGKLGDDCVGLVDEVVACGVRVDRSFAQVSSLFFGGLLQRPPKRGWPAVTVAGLIYRI